MIENIIRKVQICVPFGLLKEKYLPVVIENRMNPEIGIDGTIIDVHSKRDFLEMASILQQEGLSITLHGPFHDLVPGGIDKKILKATRERLRQAFDIIPLFEPLSIVCHTGYDRKRYHEVEDEWMDTALETWEPLVKDLQGTRTTLMLENVYEKTPTLLFRLLSGLNREKVGFCFDAGHMNAFSETDMEGWLTPLKPFLKQVHLHDNDGTFDAHLAIGAGKIDFEALFTYLGENHLKPIVTLEAHEEEWIWQSLDVLSTSEGFCRIVQS
jgi:sugar phosphate isomerase/epimerase